MTSGRRPAGTGARSGPERRRTGGARASTGASPRRKATGSSGAAKAGAATRTKSAGGSSGAAKAGAATRRKPAGGSSGASGARGRGATSGGRARAAPSGRRAGRLRRAAQGDRPYVVALFGLFVVVGAMALGPLQNYTAAADRVEALERTRDQLVAEVDGLEERRERLRDPEEVERIARTEMGLVKPGEIPFVVVTPEDEQPRVGPERGDGGDGVEGDAPWYHRLGRWLGERLSTDP